MLLEIKDGTVSRDGIPVLSRFSFEIRGTEKAAVVGRNGAGKTTLLDVISGKLDLDTDEKHPDAGLTRSRAFTTGMMDQRFAGDPDKTLEQAVLEAVMSGKPAGYRYSRDRYYYEQLYDRMLTGFGLAKSDKTRKLCEFSGGEQRKIMLIRLLLAEPDVLILDEPTNHLDLESVEWLEHYIRRYPKAVILVSHDRYFINRTADVIWEVAGGQVTRYSGGYTAYTEEKARRYQRQRKAYEAQQAEIQRERELILKFRNKPRKAAFARSRKKILDRMNPVEKPRTDDAFIHTGDLLPARPGSKWVFECVHMKIGYQKDRPLKEISFRIRRGQKIGVIGPNGSGKSTFLKTVAGLLSPLDGEQKSGAHIESAYFDQFSAEIAGEEAKRNVLEWFHDRYPSMNEKEIRDFLAGYLFRARDLGKMVENLSGGEKSRLVLAALLYPRPNFLILDEPTNNMDIPAKETLESLFRCYRGTILFVSHDRYFLSRVADSLLLFDSCETGIHYYPFGYDHYMEQRELAKSGTDIAALRTAEDQRLIEELKAVPKAEHFRLREFSTEEATLDWRFGLIRPELETSGEAFRKICLRMEEEQGQIPETLEEYMNADSTNFHQREEARDVWTEKCLNWYDVWLDTREAEDP